MRRVFLCLSIIILVAIGVCLFAACKEAPSAEVAHRVEEWEMITAPGCQDGARQGVCTQCGQLVVEVIPAIREHTVYIDEAVPSTCTTGGISEGAHCAECYTVITRQKVTPRLKHKYRDYACVYCGAKYDPIPNAIRDSESVRVWLNLTAGQSYTYDGEWSQKGEGAAYALANMGYIYTDDTPHTADGSVATYACYIGIYAADDATDAQKAVAERQAGAYLYETFARINAGQLPDTTVILLQEGITLDVSAYEWQTLRYFCGYFGTVRGRALDVAENIPAVIKGVRVKSGVTYNESVSIGGRSRNLYVSSFIGIMNQAYMFGVRFSDLSIDAVAPEGQPLCIAAPIGAVMDVTPAYERTVLIYRNTNIQHVTVDDTCRVRGGGVTAGLVGYTGAFYRSTIDTTVRLSKYSSVYIYNCRISADISSTGESVYSPCGGAVGSIGLSQMDMTGDGNYDEHLYVTLYGVVFDCRLSGYQGVGVAIGDVFGPTKVHYLVYNDYTSATLMALGEEDLRGLIGTSIALDWRLEEEHFAMPLDEDGNALPIFGRLAD